MRGNAPHKVAWCLFLRYKALNITTCFVVKTAVGVKDRNVNGQNTWQSQWQTCFKCCLSARWVMATMVLELPKTVIGVVSSNEPESPCGKSWKDFWEEEKTPEMAWQHGRARRAKRVKSALLEFACSCGTWWASGSWWCWEGRDLERQNRAAHEGVPVPAKELGCFIADNGK